MPYKWVAPELLMHYKGQDIFHTYKDEEYSEPYDFWYTWEEGYDNDFDIRELIRDLEAIGIDIPDQENHEAIIMLALDHGVLPAIGRVAGRVSTTKEAVDALFFGEEAEEEIPAKRFVRWSDGKAQVSARKLGLTRDHVVGLAKILVGIQVGLHSDSLRYQVFGESGIIVIRNGEITVIPDDPKKKERERLKEAIRKEILNILDAACTVPEGVVAAGAKAILKQMKEENRPYWTGWDLRSQATKLIERGFAAVEADYPKVLLRALKDLDKCVAASMRKGTVEPEALSAICRTLNSVLRKTQTKKRKGA